MALKKGQNPNRPKKGSRTKVEPIRKLKDIKAIKKLLAGHPRDLCLYMLGISTNLRASDLLRIKAGDVRYLSPGDTLELREKKTGKTRMITLPKTATDAIQWLFSSREFEDTDPLFLGQRGTLTVPTVNNLVKGWCKMINLKGNYGSHTLRKTFGHLQHEHFKTSIPELMVMFNHSSQRQTLEYLCIQDEDIADNYMKIDSLKL